MTRAPSTTGRKVALYIVMLGTRRHLTEVLPPGSVEATADLLLAGGGTVLITHDGGGAADAHVGSVNAFLQPYGMVIVMGDESCWSDPGGGADYTIDDADNLALLLAIFDCVPGPVRTEDHSWSGVRALFE